MENVTFEIKVGDDKVLTATIREMKFDEYRMAMMALQAQSGFDKLAAGRFVVKTCWVSGDDELKKGDESNDGMMQKAFATLCLDVFNNMITLCDSDVKKK